MMANDMDPKLSAGRLDEARLADNFSDLHPLLTAHEAAVAADRCYFCHDAPCVTVCPTSIDIPLFIRQIASDMPLASAETILDQNILGGMCARVCPTETLCEEACVREKAEGKPVEIGRLQRYATDALMADGRHPFQRAERSGHTVAVVGAGPAGLAAAHRLAMLGHAVVIFDAAAKPGGLNEFGIAAYKATQDIAQREVDWLLKIGGIEIRSGQTLGRDFSLSDLQGDYDAVFLGIGLSAVRALKLEDEDLQNVENAVDFISRLRQAEDLQEVPVGSDVVVIGGGMTAIDAAVQSKLLGAERVTLAYRGTPEKMSASQYEQELAKSKGVHFLFNATPVSIEGDKNVERMHFEQKSSGEVQKISLYADHVLKAIGQIMEEDHSLPAMQEGKIKVDADFKTSLEKVWAGGDCIGFGEDLTVTAVAQGRDAARAIHTALKGEY